MRTIRRSSELRLRSKQRPQSLTAVIVVEGAAPIFNSDAECRVGDTRNRLEPNS